MAIFQMGIITSLMPTSLIVGFTMGAAVHIATSQLKSLFGVVLEGTSGIGKVPVIWYQICKHISESNVATVVISVICLIVLIGLKEGINEHCKSHLKAQIPAELIIVIIATVVSYFAKLNEYFEVDIVGAIPIGFPAPKVPDMSKMNTFFLEAFVIALISFVITFSMADTFGRKHNYSVNTNREMFAQGMCNAVPSFLCSFAGAAAPPRCVLLSTQGGKTQLSSISTCATLLLVILLLGPYCKHLPNAALASIIIVALFPMFKQLPQAKQFWRINKPDFIIWCFTFAVVVLLGIELGLVLSNLASLLILATQSCFVRGMLMHHAQSIDVYKDSKSYERLTPNRSITVFKFESDLYFAVKQIFKDQLHNIAGKPGDFDNIAIPDKLGVNIIVIDCSSISYIDTGGINLLKQLHVEYKKVGATLVLAACTQSMVEKLYLSDIISEDNSGIPCYPTIQDAVALL